MLQIEQFQKVRRVKIDVFVLFCFCVHLNLQEMECKREVCGYSLHVHSSIFVWSFTIALSQIAICDVGWTRSPGGHLVAPPWWQGCGNFPEG